MARPRKQHHEKRDQRFNLRYTQAEIEYLRLAATRAGLPPHEYARRRSLGAPVKSPAARRSDPALINELNRIGVNLNQIARAMNMGREVEEDWQALSQELRQTLTLVMAGDGP